jgi:hypothetical protein
VGDRFHQQAEEDRDSKVKVKGGCMSRTYISAVFVLLLCPAIYAAELPMVVYTVNDDIILQDAAALRDTLGINFIYGRVARDQVYNLKNAGLGLIKWSGENNLVNRLSGESYFVASAVNSTAFPHFETRSGHPYGEFWASDTTGMALDNFWIKQRALSPFPEEQGPRQFYVKMRLAIDSAGVNLGDSIGTIYVHRLINDEWEERAAIPIFADDSLLTGRVFEVPADPPYFYLGSVNDKDVYRVKYSFWNSGKTTVYLDSLKCYNLMGLEVMNGEWDQRIADSVTTPPWDEVDGWWLRDEPKYDYFRPWGKVRSVVNDATDSLKSTGAFYMGCIHDGQSDSTLRAFELLTDQDKIVVNEYYLCGGFGDVYFTDYTGSVWTWDENGKPYERGLQAILDLRALNLLATARAEMARPDSLLKELWVSPQWFWSYCGEEGEPPNTGFIWRRPTRSELRLQVDLALCYGISGLDFWRYDWCRGVDNCGEGYSNMQGGFYDSTGTGRDSLFWQAMRDDIIPYIKAIDSVYMGLIWQRAYACSSGVPISPPVGNLISSIQAVSNSPDTNPDIGWFHVGEFVKSGTTDKYVMLVNRACSQGEWNPAEAPSITATVHFNVGNLGLGDYVLITDLADSLRHAGGDTGWVGIPRTTYSAKMPDGAIPYTIKLRAGEGKLLKIAATNEVVWSRTIAANYIY